MPTTNYFTVGPAKNTRYPALNWLARIGPYSSALFGILAVSLLWVGELYYTHNERVQTERAAIHNAENLARAFEEHIVRSIRTVDQTLLYVRDTYARDPEHFDISLWSRNSQFLNGITFQVVVIGKDGRMIASNIPGSEPGLDLSDREHFKVHAERQTDELFVSKPVLGRVSKKWSTQMTRRITMPDGSFGGVVVVSVDPDYLSQFYRSIDVGEQGAISLVGTDGIVRARGSKSGGGVGSSIADGPLLSAFARSRTGYFESRSVLDNLERLYIYRGVAQLPLIVVIGMAHEDVFSAYERKHRLELAISAILSLLLLAAAYLMMRYQVILAKARDAAEAGTRARTGFLAMMSHEIRTPTSGVIGMSEILIDSGLNAEQLPYATTLRQLAQHLLIIINDVLDFSKLEADGIEIEHIDFDLHEAVRNSVGLLAGQAKEHGLTLSVSFDPNVPRTVNGDPARLRQLLLNLAGNGLKFTKQGGVSVTVGVDGKSSAERLRLVFTVADTGIGIPKEGLPLLFREFHQLDSTISRRFGGTGLGLAICKRLIDLMGGTISVDSKMGHGTTFRFTLGYARAKNPANGALGALDAADAPPLAPLQDMSHVETRILLVEDNKTNQVIATKFIKDLGFSVDIANNGVEAVAACRRQSYDLVFMDVMMPEMDGIAATKAIRALPKWQCDPYIIALTANTQTHDRKICLAAGMDDFIGKPFTRSELAGKFAELFGSMPAAPAVVPAPRQEPAILDADVYRTLAEALGAEDAQSVVATFVEDAANRIDAMDRALGAGDLAAVKNDAHALKSSAASIGFMRLSDAARALETGIGNLPLADIERLLGDIKLGFNAARGAASHLPTSPEISEPLHV